MSDAKLEGVKGRKNKILYYVVLRLGGVLLGAFFSTHFVGD